MFAFRGYVENIVLRSANGLITHKTDDGHVVVIEYEVYGTILATGVQYNNRFCSIIRIEDRKIIHWRDYMDSLAAWNAMTARPIMDPQTSDPKDQIGPKRSGVGEPDRR